MSDTKRILFVGWGRSGKDTAAEYLSRITTLHYGGSTAWAAKEMVAEVLGVHPQTAWDTRHENREQWRQICDDLRAYDQTHLIRLALRTGEIIAGVRAGEELAAAKREKIFSYTVWINRPGTPPDPTVGFTEHDCQIVIDNDGTLEQFHEKLRDFARWAELPMRVNVDAPTTDKIRE